MPNEDVMAGSGHPAHFVGGDPVVPAQSRA